MLIPVQKLAIEYGIRASGVLHLGAHKAEESGDYNRWDWGHVWWVEGNPDLIGFLRAHLSRTDRRRQGNTVIQALLGERDGEPLTLNIANNGQSSSVLPLGTHRTEHPEVSYTGEVVTAMSRCVDSLVGEHGIEADFLNLDLQGYELPVLRGASGFLTDQARWVYCEVNVDELYQGCAPVEAVDDFLADLGFAPVATEMTRHGWGDRLYEKAT